MKQDGLKLDVDILVNWNGISKTAQTIKQHQVAISGVQMTIEHVGRYSGWCFARS